MRVDGSDLLHSANVIAPGEVERLRRRVDELEQTLVAARRRAGERLEQLHSDQEAFLSVLVHDLRNPLFAIRNVIDLLRFADAEPDQRRRAVEILNTQVHDIGRLLNDLLDASRLVRGTINLEPRSVLLSEVVASAVAISRPSLNEKKQHFAFSLPAEPVWLNADPERLAQILTHLLSNAGKFTANGGRISLSAVGSADEIVVTVADNGSGIEAEFLPRLFDLFAKAGGSQDRSCIGLGIGLTIVRKLVEMHGGTVQARSAGLGHGSAFEVRLPRLPESEAQPPTGSVDRAMPQVSTRILLVTDDADFAAELSLLLRLAGQEVDTVTSAGDVAAVAQAFSPQAMSLDLHLPENARVGFAARIRRQPGLDKVRVIAIGDTENDDCRRRAREAGCDTLLTKPIRIRDFLCAIASSDY